MKGMGRWLVRRTEGDKETMTGGFLAIVGVVALVMLYRMVDSYFEDKRND
jgi:hypothetical protein